jgi:hypothetical protein
MLRDACNIKSRDNDVEGIPAVENDLAVATCRRPEVVGVPALTFQFMYNAVYIYWLLSVYITL